MLNLIVYLLIFPLLSVGAGYGSEVKSGWQRNKGEFFLNEVRSRLPIELFQMYSFPGLEREEHFLLQELQEIAQFPPSFQFLPGKDPLFQLHPNEPKRTAVTTTEKTSPVYFNIDLISTNFTLADAIRLVIHEYGHKVHPDIKKVIKDYPFVVDRFATKVAKSRTAQDLRHQGDFFTLNVHASYPEEKPNLDDHPSERFDEHIWPIIYLESERGVLHLSPVLFSQYKRVNSDPKDNRIFAAIVVRDFEFIEQSVSLSLSYRMHKKNELTRYQNRYLEQLEFQIDSKGAVKFSAANPEYPILSLPHELKLTKENKKVILEIKFLEYWYGDLGQTNLVALVDGKKRFFSNSDYNLQENRVLFSLPEAIGKNVEVLGFHIWYTKHPNDRGPNDSTYFPYGNYFVPVKETLVISLP